MIKVIKPGFYTSVQDLGRFGLREFGVPISGALDSYSSQFANALLGNDVNASVLEITMTGPVLNFQKPSQIAISGANLSPALNGIPIHMNKVVIVRADDTLSFGQLKTGFRSYLAIKGGFLTQPILGSQSMYKGITNAASLKTGETLYFVNDKPINSNQNASLKYNSVMLTEDVLEVMKGPEFYELSEVKQEKLLNSEFKVSKYNNRMAYQLEPLFQNNLKSIITSPVLPGTVQLTSSGQLIALMRDCQTTGGYPRVLQLTEKSINILSQKITNTNLKFRLKE